MSVNFYICMILKLILLFVIEEKKIDEKRQGEILSLRQKSKKRISKKMYLESYGCAMNFSDSEIVASILQTVGYSTTKEIESADLVLIPVAASHVDFWATGAIVDIAKKANKKILIQINRSSQRSKLISKTNEFIKSLDLSATKTIIGNRQIFAASMGEGKTAIEKQKKSNAVEEIKNLSEQILSELK